jgi:hypothetical protein
MKCWALTAIWPTSANASTWRAGKGHKVIGLVYDQALSGGFITSGLMADACYALPDATIRVMGLPAMARITKVPEVADRAGKIQSRVCAGPGTLGGIHGAGCLMRWPAPTPATAAGARRPQVRPTSLYTELRMGGDDGQRQP